MTTATAADVRATLDARAAAINAALVNDIRPTLSIRAASMSLDVRQTLNEKRIEVTVERYCDPCPAYRDCADCAVRARLDRYMVERADIASERDGSDTAYNYRNSNHGR